MGLSSNRTSEAWRLALGLVAVLGLASVITQLTVMRELLGAFAGNELALGAVLGNWLLLTGLGTWLGRALSRWRQPWRVFLAGQIAVALIPLGQIAGIRLLRDVLFIRGAAFGVTETVLGSLVVLLPFCLISGGLLTVACGLVADRRGPAGIGEVYVADGLGSILGGMLFSFVLVERFDHFTLLGFPALLSLLVVLGIAWAAKQRFFQALSGLLLLSLSALLCLWDVDALLTARQYSGQKVLARVNSPYGRLLVTELAGQYNFIENGLPLFSAPNVEQAEEMAHYAMAQRPDARRVLLMSGGIAGAARELLKHRVNNVVYVELDPAILELGRAHFADSLADPRLQMVSRDGRRFIQRTRQHFEVVILGLPDPATSQLNRFFTAEFFAEVKSAMTTNGVLAFSLGHYENYLSAHLARMLASACQSLRQSFANILVLPVGRVYFLASDGPLSTDIAGALERSKIHTQLVNRHYLDAMLTTDRMAAVQSALQQPAARNTDFAPVLYYYHLRYWMSQFQSRFGAPEAAFLVVLAVYLFRLRAAPLALFASGFAASALEVVILLAFQVLYGSLYRQLGIIVTLFMAGLALGAWTANRGGLRAGQKELAGLSLAVAAFGAALPAALHGVRWVGGLPPAWWLGQWLIPLLGFVLATLIGWQFPLASRVDFASATGTAARLYSADLLGACLGAFLASTLLIPLVGVTTTCLLSALLNGLAGLRVWRAAPRLGFLA